MLKLWGSRAQQPLLLGCFQAEVLAAFNKTETNEKKQPACAVTGTQQTGTHHLQLQAASWITKEKVFICQGCSLSSPQH